VALAELEAGTAVEAPELVMGDKSVDAGVVAAAKLVTSPEVEVLRLVTPDSALEGFVGAVPVTMSVLIVRDDSVLGAEDEAPAVVELEVPIA
jgi:hypothetical protein